MELRVSVVSKRKRRSSSSEVLRVIDEFEAANLYVSNKEVSLEHSE